MPKNGLQDNKVVLKMLTVKPIKVYRGKTLDSLKKSTNEILKKHRLIKHNMENSKDFVVLY
jgi:hypothetical protein